MARQVLHGAVPLAVLPVGGRFQDACPVRTGTLKLSTDIPDPDTDEVRRPGFPPRLPARRSATIIAPSAPMLICAR